MRVGDAIWSDLLGLEGRVEHTYTHGVRVRFAGVDRNYFYSPDGKPLLGVGPEIDESRLADTIRPLNTADKYVASVYHAESAVLAGIEELKTLAMRLRLQNTHQREDTLTDCHRCLNRIRLDIHTLEALLGQE